MLDVRAKCPRFSRVHFSDREADSVSINYAGRFAGPIFIYSSRTDGREKGADGLNRPWAKGRTTGSECREPFVLRAEGMGEGAYVRGSGGCGGGRVGNYDSR